ncbi:hypothetical protein OSB04_009913 [Centaurea solstitialis]|uniref:Membrane-associated kinase regulator 2 n=1 Tax=Centaurea solstitialis TaxID=347529 RepID=A0AA38T6I4_9ASTR|nr:hypothetical protein OSB04_009913 [Centaurea solstitialis]
MEAFSLLRYWRTNAATTTTTTADTTATATTTADVRTSTATSTTIVTAVSAQTSETEDNEGENDDNDHGPFFDLEFSLPAEGEGDDEHAKEDGETDEGDSDGSDESDEEEDERELKFTLLSGTSSGGSTTDANISVSPSDDLFFKGSFVPVHQTTETNSNSDSKTPQFRVSLMKSATKFRVMMLKFNKKPKNAESVEEGTTEDSNASGCSSNSKKEEGEEKSEEDSGKSTTVKFKIEEVPIVSLFKRHNSSKKAPKKRENSEEQSVSDEKKFSKEAMQRYLRKVKPLYVRVSKRYGEKLKFTGQLNLAPSPEEQKPSPVVANVKREKESTIPEASEPPLLVPSNGKGLKQGNLPAGLRVVCKHLGKSRSAASTAVVAASPPPSTVSANRRDDSLLQQQDGIQSAILHCKRSFKASRDSDCSSRSSSSAYTKCLNNWSSDETEKGDDCGQKAGI